MPNVSIVIPLYNQEAYLPGFLQCLAAQSLEDFEAVFVDDASTDASRDIVRQWAARDDRFKLIEQPENRGAGAARNVGIDAATGETLCFADPDDLLPEHSLAVRYAAYKQHNAIVRACHVEKSSSGRIINAEIRPDNLPEVFSPVQEAAALGSNPFLCAHWTWLFPTKLLQRLKIYNPEGTCTAEDIIFLVRLFFHISRMVWIPDTVYYWMKRKDSLSTTAYSRQHYLEYLQCVDALYEQAERAKQADPREALKIADIFCNGYLMSYLLHLSGQLAAGRSSEEDAAAVIQAAAAICTRWKSFSRLAKGQIPPQRVLGLQWLLHILQNPAPSAAQKILEGYLEVHQRLKSQQYEQIKNKGWEEAARFDTLDRSAGLLRARYLFHKNPPPESYCLDGLETAPTFTKNRSLPEAGDREIFERILWLPIPDAGDKSFELRIGGRSFAGSTAAINASFTGQAPNGDISPDIRAMRRLAASAPMRERFADAWLFIDKDSEADDNAEHLYRHVMRLHPEINAWFVLSRHSHDWPRLEREGFKLIPFGEELHTAAYLNATHLISSQMDAYIFQRVDEQLFADFPKPKFVCLPHGVTKDDVSGWFNSIPFDLFIAATPMESASITEDGSPYVMCEKEVRLGGFPRYDKWLEPVEREDLIFVMPTWRADLVGAWDGKGQAREFNPAFYDSAYAKTWQDFFNAPELAQLLRDTGFRITFFAHPGVEPYLDGLRFPDFVEKRGKSQGSIIPVMQRAKVMITDFSSVAFDMAYMHKPVLYYQYESKAQFTRQQAWKSGYIDYQSMGFGPVCRDRATLLQALSACLRADCAMEEIYLERVRQTFPYRDANCCQRAFSFIMDSSTPRLP